MYFLHSPEVWKAYPHLCAGALCVDRVEANDDIRTEVELLVGPLHDAARTRLAATAEGEFSEVQAWRRAFGAMGLKPTQYRNAAEALLRRLRKEGQAPSVHPLVDLCNAFSMAFAVPIAAFDLDRITGGIEVRKADGTETFETFTGATEHPAAGEIVFVDEASVAHSRRWTHRQSARSAIRLATRSAIIVAEALHEGARECIAQLIEELERSISQLWHVGSARRELTREAPLFDW